MHSMTLKESIDRLSTDAENFMVHGTATNQRPYTVLSSSSHASY
jgi:hypothetical protein